MKQKLTSLLLSITVVFSGSMGLVLATPATALAASAAYCAKSSTAFLGLPTWYKYLGPVQEGDQCVLKTVEDSKNPDTGQVDAAKVVGPVLLAVFEIILRFAGLAAVVFIIYGGFQYLLSQGEPDRLKGARSTILNALIGLAIALSGTAIVNLIGGKLT